MEQMTIDLFNDCPDEIRNITPVREGFQLDWQNQNGRLYQGNSLEWLASLESKSVDMVFADPPYNIKKADWDNFESQEKYIEWSMVWVRESARILKDTGCLYICGFSEILADIKHPASQHFDSCRWLIWHYKNKANLGKDWGRSHESIVHLRKSDHKINADDIRIPYGAHTLRYPSHPQALTSAYGGSNKGKRHESWVPNPKGAKPKDVFDIPTTCNGMGESTPHPTQKPEELLRKLVLASSNDEDIVVDPFSGSGTTLVVAEQLGRKWLGCDLNIHYNSWAIRRIKSVRKMTKEEWIAFDRKNAERRESIR